jgi:hypothetical protein
MADLPMMPPEYVDSDRKATSQPPTPATSPPPSIKSETIQDEPMPASEALPEEPEPVNQEEIVPDTPASSPRTASTGVVGATLAPCRNKDTPSKESVRPASRPKRKHNPEGVFARKQFLPWPFHVLNEDEHKSAVLLIEVHTMIRSASLANLQHFGGRITPLDRALIIVVPRAGIREANTSELVKVVESAMTQDKAVISIDWINQCVEEDDQLDIDPYRITLPPVEAAPDIKMDVDFEPAHAPVLPSTQNVEYPIQRSRNPSTCVQPSTALTRAPLTGLGVRNATAGPSGIRHFTVPRDVITIKDDDDGDYVNVKDLPRPTTKPQAAVPGANYPSPPSTPVDRDAILRLPAAQGVSASTSHADLDGVRDDDEEEEEGEEEEEETNGDVRSRSPQRDCQHDPKAADKAPPLVTDPAERAQILQNGVPEASRHPFDQLEQALQQWAIEGLNGYMTDFVRKTEKEVSAPTSTHSDSLRCKLGDEWPWRYILKNYRHLYNQIVPGLFDKGIPKRRGPKKRVPKATTLEG